MLCAQHALNALLQGNYYDPSQLADVAKQLDELERSQLDEEAWRNRDVASLNMDDTGEYRKERTKKSYPCRMSFHKADPESPIRHSQVTSAYPYWKQRWKFGVSVCYDGEVKR
jgi:hypothetical protein